VRVEELPDGRRVAVKHDPSAQAEAAGLRWLAESGDVAVPEVYAVDDDVLRTEYLPPSAPTESAAREFGAGLAALHLRGADAFGSPPPGGPAEAWIGRARMRNEPHDDWPTFYAELRVEPYVRQARDSGSLTAGQASVISRACEVIRDASGPDSADEPPARLHGDLWSGNVHFSRGRAWLIDPAAHGGHRETDLAMLQLFGAPHLTVILEAYADAAAAAGAPLADGWAERTPMHQLFPLLVHTVLFGGGYAARAEAAARRTLALA